MVEFTAPYNIPDTEAYVHVEIFHEMDEECRKVILDREKLGQIFFERADSFDFNSEIKYGYLKSVSLNDRRLYKGILKPYLEDIINVVYGRQDIKEIYLGRYFRLSVDYENGLYSQLGDKSAFFKIKCIAGFLCKFENNLVKIIPTYMRLL